MALRDTFRRLIPWRWQRTSLKEPLSIVLLLRKPHLFTEDEMRLAAQRAYHTSFAGTDGSINCVAKAGIDPLLIAGPHLLKLFHYPHPYIDDPSHNVKWLPQAIQRKAWCEHTACVGVDYFNEDVDLELAYSVLTKLAAEMLDGNCTAIYMPRDNRLIPNYESAYLELQSFASSRNLGIVPPSTPD